MTVRYRSTQRKEFKKKETMKNDLNRVRLTFSKNTSASYYDSGLPSKYAVYA